MLKYIKNFILSPLPPNHKQLKNNPRFFTPTNSSIPILHPCRRTQYGFFIFLYQMSNKKSQIIIQVCQIKFELLDFYLGQIWIEIKFIFRVGLNLGNGNQINIKYKPGLNLARLNSQTVLMIVILFFLKFYILFYFIFCFLIFLYIF